MGVSLQDLKRIALCSEDQVLPSVQAESKSDVMARMRI